MDFTTRTTQLANAMRSTILKNKRNSGKGKQPSDSSTSLGGFPHEDVNANNANTLATSSSTSPTHTIQSSGPGRGITESNSLERVPEDEGPLSFSQLLRRSDYEEDMHQEAQGEYDEDENLRVDGYEYTGNYRTLLQQHILISTLTFILVLILFYLPSAFSYFFPLHNDSKLHPDRDIPIKPFSLRHILPTILLSTSIWTLAHTLKIPIFSFLSFIDQPFLFTPYAIKILLSIVVYTSIQELLRLSSFTILNLHLHSSHYHNQQITRDISFHHPFFTTTYFIAFGWALAEIIALTYQAFSQLSSYKDALPSSSTDIIDSVATPGIGFGNRAADSAGARYVHGILERNDNGHESDTKSRRSYGTMTADRGRPVVRRVSSNTIDTRIYQEDDGIADSLSVERAAADEEPRQITIDTSAVANDDGENYDKGYKTIDIIDVDQEEEVNGEEDVENLLDEEITRLMNVKRREELEEIYGVAFVDIPIFLIFLQRINSIILSYGFTFLLSFAYLSSSGPTLSLLLMYVIVVITHSILSSIHAPSILPRIGIHTAAYVSLVMGLGVLFAGLGVWGVVS